ncbi:MAG: hypothetical protein V3U29_05395 [Phycisphaeraceae bacterium]
MRQSPNRIQIVAITGCLVCFAMNAQPAIASFHLWDITEVYSNADGTLQFIEWFTSSNLQHLLAGHVVTSDSSTYTFPINLPSSGTAVHHFLMATAGFAALPGAPTPDYIFPAGFIDTTGDTLRLRTSLGGTIWETFSFGSGELPTDGINSLVCAIHFGSACTSTDVEVNSPTNFAGQEGSVSPPPPCPADFDGSGDVGAFDLAILLGAWGPCHGCPTDLSGDGDVGAFDLAILLGAWGPCP